MEGYYNTCLLLIGTEITPPTNHYLALEIEKPISREKLNDPQAFIQEVKNKGGFGFLAHPGDTGNKLLKITSRPWHNFAHEGYHGIEIWNHLTDINNNITSIPKLLQAILNPLAGLKGPNKNILRKWDELGDKRHIVAIGGVDAHGVRVKLVGFSLVLFPYEKVFKTIRTHVLTRSPFTGEFMKDKNKIIQSLIKGRCYINQALLGQEPNFLFYLRTEHGIFNMGDELVQPNLGVFHISLAERAFITLLMDGNIIATGDNCKMHHPLIGKGVYRVKIEKKIKNKYYPWIFSNPIFVR